MAGEYLVGEQSKQAIILSLPDLVAINAQPPAGTFWPPENFAADARQTCSQEDPILEFQIPSARGGIGIGRQGNSPMPFFPCVKYFLKIRANVRQETVAGPIIEIIIEAERLSLSIQREASE